MSRMGRAQTKAILQALAGGSAAALEALYDAYAAPVYHLLCARGANREEAEDLLQEVFLALLERGRKVADIEDVAAYLFAIARNKLSRLHQPAQVGGNNPVQLEVVAAPALDPAARDQALRVQDALSDLPPEQREVVILKVWDEFTFAEIAEVLGIPPNTAASRYRYALTKLRELLGEDDHE